mgnify:CR=1 FL=1
METSTIWCVGRNYAKHAKEMNEETPQSPLIFIKSGGCLEKSSQLTLPSFSKDVHHELEIALKLNDQLQPESIALALDLTARDIQGDLKKNGLPWALAKSFKGSCPISEWIPFKGDQWFAQLCFQMEIEGTLRQYGETKDMVFQPQELIHYLKSIYPLQPGDIILSGTPEGVGPLNPGEQIQAKIHGLLEWKLQIAP